MLIELINPRNHTVVSTHCHLRLSLQPKVKLLINGEFKDSATDQWIDVTNPVSSSHTS